MSNLFASTPAMERHLHKQSGTRYISIPDYSQSPSGIVEHTAAATIGFAIGFIILFVFYKAIILAIIGGAVYGIVNIFAAAKRATGKRGLATGQKQSIKAGLHHRYGKKSTRIRS